MSKGFTFIEILIVIAIIGSLLVVGYGGIRESTRRKDLEAAASQVRGDLRLVQQFSLSRGKPAGASCDTLNSYNFHFVDTNTYSLEAGCSSGSVPLSGKTLDLPTNYAFATPLPAPIEFNVLGKGTNITGSINIRINHIPSSKYIDITVGQGGEIK